jgi:hypothetical protein
MGGKSLGRITIENTGTVRVDSDNTVAIEGLDNIRTRTELVVPEPIVTDSKGRVEVAVTQPIVTQTEADLSLDVRPLSADLALDVRPLVADLCLKLDIGELPDTRIRQPYQAHFGITLFGLELLGFNFAGEAQLVVQNLPRRPHSVFGEQRIEPARRQTPVTTAPDTGGIRVRIGD